MNVYFDTSALVPLLIEEAQSQLLTDLWDRAGHVVSSRLVYVETRSALAIAHRIKRIGGKGLERAVAEFESLHGQLDIVEVTEDLLREAASLAEAFALGGYDALHLASAQIVHDSDTVFAAGDSALLSAARELGMATSN